MTLVKDNRWELGFQLSSHVALSRPEILTLCFRAYPRGDGGDLERLALRHYWFNSSISPQIEQHWEGDMVAGGACVRSTRTVFV